MPKSQVLKKVLRAAHFVLCERCSSHGWIVYSDGSKGESVGSQSDALHQLDQPENRAKLAPCEIAALEDQILDSGLPIFVSLPIEMEHPAIDPNVTPGTVIGWRDVR